MDVYTYNPSTTALENIFRHGPAGFPLFRTPSWASLSSSSSSSSRRIGGGRDSNINHTSHRSKMELTIRSARKLSIRDQESSDDEEMTAEDQDVDMDPAEEREPWSASVPITATAVLRIPGPAPWTAGNSLLGEWESPLLPPPPRTPRSPLPEIKLAPRAQADTNSQLDSYLHFLTGHTLGVSDLRTMAAAAEEANPMSGLGEPPAVSFQTIAITGILVDIFGLDDLSPLTTHLSVLWLHNPRLGDRTRMHHLAKRAVSQHNQTKSPQSTRGLIAVAFDQRNHGVREVHPLANQSWKKGNPHHAQDMFGIVSGTVVDTRLLIDALPGYLFLEAKDKRPEFDQHICLGVSLGGHSTWQTLFTDPRVTAGVSIIGCPDFQLLMKDRARLSKLSTYDKSTKGSSFLGSKDFPPALVSQCAQYDPKGIVFGTGNVTEAPATEAEQKPLRQILDRTVRGKRILLCTGGDDKLVPWRCSESFTKFFVYASESWYKDAGLRVDNRIYPGVGHECSDEMVMDAVKFICEAVSEGPAGVKAEEKVEAKI